MDTSSVEYNAVNFSSLPSHTFRASISTGPDGVVFWAENKKSKQQWQASTTKMGDAGPPGMPEDDILAFLKVVFL